VGQYKTAGTVERLGLTITAHHAPPPQLLITNPLTLLDHTGDDGSLSSDLVLLLLLFLLVTSSDVKPYPLTLVPRRCSPSSSTVHRLGPTVESQDLGAPPLPDGARVVCELMEQTVAARTLEI
jgi:hypothetical protein